VDRLRRFKLRKVLQRGARYTAKRIAIKAYGSLSAKKKEFRLAKSRLRPEYVHENSLRRAIGCLKTDDISEVAYSSSVNFLCSSNVREAISELTDENVNEICTLADNWVKDKPTILDHEYNFSLDGTNHYPWHEDFLSKSKYPYLFYTELKVGQSIREGDIKVPWELSRMHGLIPLAQAYLITGNIVYKDKIKWLIKDFHVCNPCGYGVNWMCTMEVGIRILNILTAYSLIRDTCDPFDSIHSLVLIMSIEHGIFIRGNLETSGKLQSNNHYIANLLGLIGISCAYPDVKVSKKWRNFACAELFREIKRQILPDGLSFEGTISYTRLTGEMFYFSRVIMRTANIKIPEEFDQRLYELANAINWLTAQDGCVPQIGDNDSGRILVFAKRDSQKYDYLASLIKYELGDRAGLETSQLPELVWLYGDNVSSVNASLSDSHTGVKRFLESGITVYKTDDVYFLCAAVDAYKHDVPGHMHNDKLSFILQFKGKDFFVDPGTGIYTGNIAVRNELRSTKSHNTVMIQQHEQNRFGNSAFSLYYDGSASLVCDENEGSVRITGKHDCYLERLGITHKREFLVSNKSIFIRDSYDSTKPTNLETLSTFVLHPAVTIKKEADNTAILNNGHINIRLKTHGEIRIRKGLYSQKYNQWEETMVIETRGTTQDIAISEVELLHEVTNYLY
jgi:hypothetical protein